MTRIPLPAMAGAMLVVTVLLIHVSEDSAYGQASVLQDKTLTDSRNGHSMSLQFVDGSVSGYVQPAGSDRVELDHSLTTVSASGGRLTVVDPSSQVTILMRDISADRYLVLVKVEVGDGSGELRIRFVADASAPKFQRDLMAEQEAARRAAEEAEVAKTPGDLDRQEKLERASAEVRLFIEREEERFRDSSAETAEEILARVAADQGESRADSAREMAAEREAEPEESEDTQDASEAEDETPAELVLSESGTKTFLSVPFHVEWNSELEYSVLITDDKKVRFDTKFDAFIGEKLIGANVTVNIVAPDGAVLETFNGTTDADGAYHGGWLVPTNHETGTEHTVTANSTVIFDDNTYAVSEGEAPFFVNPS